MSICAALLHAAELYRVLLRCSLQTCLVQTPYAQNVFALPCVLFTLDV